MSDLDHDKLIEEINEEVRRRRESGDIPADLERELGLVFARFAPVEALEADFEQVLLRAEQAAFIDTIAPVESSRPVVPFLKRIVRKILGWYIRYVAHQTSAFAKTATRALRLLGERVDVLEQASPLAAARVTLPPGPSDDTAHWAPIVAERLRGTEGRVMQGESGDGALLAALVGAGLDAYGVDPHPDADTSRLEVREDDVDVHLRAVPDAALGAVVLTGCVDRLPLGGQLRLADLVASKVAPGGVVVVLGRDPVFWQRGVSPLQADLSPGRPLHAATWQHLLAERGLVEVETLDGPREAGLEPVPKGDAVLNENIARINAALFGPSSYAVVARRPT